MTTGLLNQSCIAQAIQDMTAAEKTAVCASLNCTPAALSQTPASGAVLPTAAPASGASPFFILTPGNALYFWSGAAYSPASTGSGAPTGAQIYAALIAAPITNNFELSYCRLTGANGNAASATSSGAFNGSSFTVNPTSATFTSTRKTDAIISVGVTTTGGPTTSGLDSATLAIWINGVQDAVSSQIIYQVLSSGSINIGATCILNGVSVGDVISVRVITNGNQSILNDPSSYVTVKPLV